MLPYIVITAAIIFFLLQRSGLFEELRRRDRDVDRPRRRREERVQRKLDHDPEVNQRLEVFKDFLEREQDDEE
jgi:hypothetical protein